MDFSITKIEYLLLECHFDFGLAFQFQTLQELVLIFVAFGFQIFLTYQKSDQELVEIFLHISPHVYNDPANVP